MSMGDKTMKKAIVLILVILLLTISIFGCFGLVYANSAPPRPDNIGGTGIVFEKYDKVSVLSEELNIELYSEIGVEIEAKYKMKNLTNETLEVNAMFVSPQRHNSLNFLVQQDDKKLQTTEEIYFLDFNNSIGISENDWQYIIENGKKAPYYIDEHGEYKQLEDIDEVCVSAVSYLMNFEPNQETTIFVRYFASLENYFGGRYATYGFEKYIKPYGELRYFLTPARYWNDFNDLTINIKTAEEGLTEIIESSVDFKKTKTGDYYQYQFKADKLPQTELIIKFGDTSFNNMLVYFANPYFWYKFMPIIAIVLILLAMLVVAIVCLKNKKSRSK